MMISFRGRAKILGHEGACYEAVRGKGVTFLRIHMNGIEIAMDIVARVDNDAVGESDWLRSCRVEESKRHRASQTDCFYKARGAQWQLALHHRRGIVGASFHDTVDFFLHLLQQHRIDAKLVHGPGDDHGGGVAARQKEHLDIAHDLGVYIGIRVGIRVIQWRI